MLRMGFDEEWGQGYDSLYIYCRLSCFIGGEAWGPIIPSWGLRQGAYPLSPYLFLLVVDGLCGMIQVQEEGGGGILWELITLLEPLRG